MKNGLSKTLQNTRFAGSPIVTVSARPGGPEVSVTCVANGNSFSDQNNGNTVFLFHDRHQMKRNQLEFKN